MAIDLFCYSSKSIPTILKLNNELVNAEPLFPTNKFHFGNPFPVEAFTKEWLKTFNYQAQNLFLVRLIDKNEADKIQQVAELIIRKYEKDILILFENETLLA